MAEPMTRSTAPFVGREAELSQLYQCLQSCLQDKQPGFALIQGDFGVGKTALVTRFLAEVASRCPSVLVGQGKCAAQTELSGLVPFGQLLAGLAQPRFLQRAALGSLFEYLREVAPAWLDVVTGGAVGAIVTTLEASKKLVARSTYSQESVFVQFTNALTRIAEKQPVVGFIDDLHWADASSLQLLFHLVRNLEKRPVLIVCTYRPVEGLETGPNAQLFGSIQANLMRYGARELKIEHGIDVKAYAALRYPGNTFPAVEVERIQEFTDGHALYVNQLFSLWEETDAIVSLPGPDGSPMWRLAEHADMTQPVLSSVGDVLGERIRLIKKDLQDILSCASVEGEDFTVQVIARLRELDEYVVCDGLETLDQRYHLLEESQGEGVEPKVLDFYRFVHRFFREYVYGQMSASKRRLLHGRVAECLEVLYGDRRPIAGQLALHFREARQMLRAARYATVAAEFEQSRFAWSEGESWCEFGLALLDRLPQGREVMQLRVELLARSGDGYYYCGKYLRSEERYAQALGLAMEMRMDPEKAARLCKRLADVKEYEGRYEEALAFLERGRHILADESVPYGPVHASLDAFDGFLQTRMGLDGSAVEALRGVVAQAEILPRTPELTHVISDAINSLGIALSRLGRYAEAISAYEQSMRIDDEAGVAGFQSAGWLNVAQCYLRMGMLDESRACVSRGLDAAKRIGQLAHEAYGRSLNGAILLAFDKPQEAATELDQAIALAQQVGAGWDEATMFSNSALAYLALSDLERAIERAKHGVACAEENSNPFQLGFAYDALARIEAEWQQWDIAAKHFGQAVLIHKGARHHHYVARTQRHYAEMLLRCGERQQAEDLLRQALTTLQELGLAHEIAKTQCLLGEGCVGSTPGSRATA